MARSRSRFPEDGLRDVISRVIDTRAEAERISPAWVATEAMLLLDAGRNSPPLVYHGCHLQLRQMARHRLRGKYEPDGEAEDDDVQHSLFPDLQRRYPTSKSAKSDDPEYALLEYLSDVDITYNLARLRGEAGAKLRHADALEAWWRSHPIADVDAAE